MPSIDATPLCKTPPVASSSAVPFIDASPNLILIALEVTVAVPLILPVKNNILVPSAVTSAVAFTAADPNTSLAPAVCANDEKGVSEYDDNPNIYKTTHLDPLGIVTDCPDATVIGPTDIAYDPLGIE
jgi:hypothetical protein